MKFLNRQAELARLDALLRTTDGGLAVVYGRRRVGKTRLLVEWCHRHAGVYTVADQSTADIQRRYFARALSARFPGFESVIYPDWGTLFDRLADAARAAAWRGPLVLDELPYWVETSPELPSVLQRWLDHTARAAKLTVAIAGSSQRMMQGLVLDRDAPLFGRASVFFEVQPLHVGFATHALGRSAARDVLDFYTAFGGIPQYWERFHDLQLPTVAAAIDSLVLDPEGTLHREPDRLLLEELPSAAELRPVLDAIGGGAHRFSEIAARIGRPTTALSRPLDRLLELGLVIREVPFGEPVRSGKKSLYKIADPFMRMWFRVVAPHRAELVAGTPKSRLALLARYWEGLASAAWEDLCRASVPRLDHQALGEPGDWKPASRWWSAQAEWDVVAEDVGESRLLLGECKLSPTAKSPVRPPPDLPARYKRHTLVYALFLPESRRTTAGALPVVTLKDIARQP